MFRIHYEPIFYCKLTTTRSLESICIIFVRIQILRCALLDMKWRKGYIYPIFVDLTVQYSTKRAIISSTNMPVSDSTKGTNVPSYQKDQYHITSKGENQFNFTPKGGAGQHHIMPKQLPYPTYQHDHYSFIPKEHYQIIPKGLYIPSYKMNQSKI